jgi:hypothetical protein
MEFRVPVPLGLNPAVAEFRVHVHPGKGTNLLHPEIPVPDSEAESIKGDTLPPAGGGQLFEPGQQFRQIPVLPGIYVQLRPVYPQTPDPPSLLPQQIPEGPGKMKTGGGKQGVLAFPQDFKRADIDAPQERGSQGFVLDPAADKLLSPAKKLIPQKLHPLPQGRGNGTEGKEGEDQKGGEDEETEDPEKRRAGSAPGVLHKGLRPEFGAPGHPVFPYDPFRRHLSTTCYYRNT